ncbi:uncharacterized protein LOC117317386 [Pecten maximus]|uniref:uncharacterized protein LOC117317386 n=1 Tax=Pecten maximus TaxID=6579 RepID=UPI0014585494|nr:uncharacterized protein LOC117317386 [Pecten maximus]
MSCKEFLIKTITIVGGCPVQLKVSFILITLTFCTNLTAMVTCSWLAGSTPDTRQGLFWYCIQQGSTECCAQLEDYAETQNMTVPAFVQATRTFAGIGVCSLFGTLVLCMATVMVSRKAHIKKEMRFNIGANILSFLIIVIGVIVYGAKFPDDMLTNRMGPSWSFGFSAFAACVCLVNALVLFSYEA